MGVQENCCVVCNYESFVKKIDSLKKEFKDTNRTGSITAFVIWAGGWEKVFEVFHGYAGFTQTLLNLGYSKSYIYRLKNKWQKEFKGVRDGI